jgi:hypothetical protein
MIEYDRHDERGPDLQTQDDDAIAAKLWTRRSALALTAGFFALAATPGSASGYVQRLEPRELVFDARIAPCLTMPSSLANTSFLTSIFSNTASMTRSQSAKSA